MASTYHTERRGTVAALAGAIGASWWTIALAVLAVLALSHTLSGLAVQAMSDRLGAPLMAPIGPVTAVVFGMITSVVKFVLLALAFVGILKALGAAVPGRAMVTAFLLVPFANLAASALWLLGLQFAAFADGVVQMQEAPVLDTASRAVMWMILTPLMMTVALVGVSVVAARAGGELDWGRAGVAGLAIGAASLALAFAFFALVTTPETALRIALGQILRMG